MNYKIVVINPSIDDLNWNNDKTSFNREDFHAQVVIKHSVQKITQKKHENKCCKSASIKINSEDQGRVANKKAFSIYVRMKWMIKLLL